MRLRLFERLGRLVGWRPGLQGDGSGRSGDSRSDGAEVGGRHRRNTGAGSGQPPSPAASARQRSQLPPLQPPAGLPRRPPHRGATAGASPVPRSPNGGGRSPALPPLPRNYSPTARGGGGAGRARIREAPPFGAAPVETATRDQALARGQDGASQSPADAAPKQPWYQVVGGPAGRAQGRQAASAGQAGGGAGRCGAGSSVRPGGGPGAGCARPEQGGAAVRRPASARTPDDRRWPAALRAA